MPDPEMRASDAEREETIERLRAAAGEGRLTLEELADRIDVVSGSRTRTALEQVTADLPAESAAAAALAGSADEAGRAPTAGTTGTGPGVTIAQPHEVATVPTRNTAFFGDLKRSGPWQLPAQSRWDTLFGDVKLDLREAQVPAGEIVIDARTGFGDIELLVPEGVLVEVRSSTVFGDVKQSAGISAAPGAPRIVLTGNTIFGDVRVQAKRLRERLAERWLG